MAALWQAQASATYFAQQQLLLSNNSFVTEVLSPQMKCGSTAVHKDCISDTEPHLLTSTAEKQPDKACRLDNLKGSRRTSSTCHVSMLNIWLVCSNTGVNSKCSRFSFKFVNLIFRLFALSGSRTSPNCCSNIPTNLPSRWTVPQTWTSFIPWGLEIPLTPPGSRLGLNFNCSSFTNAKSLLLTSLLPLWTSFRTSGVAQTILSWQSVKKWCGPKLSVAASWEKGWYEFKIWKNHCANWTANSWMEVSDWDRSTAVLCWWETVRTGSLLRSPRSSVRTWNERKLLHAQIILKPDFKITCKMRGMDAKLKQINTEPGMERQNSHLCTEH